MSRTRSLLLGCDNNRTSFINTDGKIAFIKFMEWENVEQYIINIYS